MKNLKRIAAGAFSALFWLSIWTLAAYICAKEVLLPSPLSVLRSLASLAASSQFWISCAMSLLRVCAGLAAGAVLGIACAAVSIRWEIGRALISPALSVIRATPVASVFGQAAPHIHTEHAAGVRRGFQNKSRHGLEGGRRRRSALHTGALDRSLAQQRKGLSRNIRYVCLDCNRYNTQHAYGVRSFKAFGFCQS